MQSYRVTRCLRGSHASRVTGLLELLPTEILGTVPAFTISNLVIEFAVEGYLTCLRGLSYKNQSPLTTGVVQRSWTFSLVFHGENSQDRRTDGQTLDTAQQQK